MNGHPPYDPTHVPPHDGSNGWNQHPHQSQHPHESSGESSPPGRLETPAHGPVLDPLHDYVPRGVLEPQTFFHNLQSPHQIQYFHPGPSGPTSPFQGGDDEMKRSLDTSSLPNNPHNGLQPQIDPSSSFENAPNAPPKRARHSPAVNATSPSAPGPSSIRIFTPRGPQPPYIGGSSFMSHPQPGQGPPGQGLPQSPLHLGGPLATPQQPTSNGQHALHNGQMTMPQSPYMGMMNMNGFPMNSMPYMGYPMSPIMSPSMNPHTMTGNYGPAAAAAAVAAAGNITGRTVYVGSLPAEASVDELLNLVRFGPIENVRLLPEKSCVFISFLDGSTAAAFHADASVKKLALHGQELKIGWGKPSGVPHAVVQAVANSQATRNVFVGNLEESINEQDLRNDLQKFGPIDQVKIVRDKNIGFIHFLSIGTAMKVVSHLPSEQKWIGKRVNYGKDRCAYVPKAQQAAVQAAQAQAAAAIAAQHAQMPGSPFGGFSPMAPTYQAFGTPNSAFQSPMMPTNGFPMNDHNHQIAQPGNRTIYIGNIHPDTTIEELCNNIRGGVIEQIRRLHEKNIAFVTFVDPACALAFFNHANHTGLTVNTRRLKIGWGKHSGSLPPALLQAVQAGASRNVYIGQITDFELLNEAKLRQDFGQFGLIEMINFLREKGAAFVNFTSISSAQKAIDGIKELPEYANLRISFGKDRCANQPRVVSGTPGSARPAGQRTVSQTSVPHDAVQERIEAIERANAEVNDHHENGFVAAEPEEEVSYE